MNSYETDLQRVREAMKLQSENKIDSASLTAMGSAAKAIVGLLNVELATAKATGSIGRMTPAYRQRLGLTDAT